jgi:hypothetical protein
VVSEVVEECEQPVRRTVAAGPSWEWCDPRESAFLDRHVGVEIGAARGFDSLKGAPARARSPPCRPRFAAGPWRSRAGGCGGWVPGAQRWAVLAGGSGVPGHQCRDCAAAESGAPAAGEQRVGGVTAALLQAYPEHGHRLPGYRRATVLPAFAAAADMGAGAQFDVAVAQAGQLGDPKAGLGCHLEQGVISPAGPVALVGCGHQGVELGPGQVGDLGPRAAFRRGGQDLRDEPGVLGDGAAPRSGRRSGWQPGGRSGCGRCCDAPALGAPGRR